MRARVGIITHYYNSTNYGGILQSYALCEYLNQNGFESKQICYAPMKYPVRQYIKHRGAYLYLQLKNAMHPKAWAQILKRKKAFVKFRGMIPHTSKVYSNKDLMKTNELFDIFITGSDQVWHPSVINYGYSLEFSQKPKYSYAASVASSVIPNEKTKSYAQLKSFKAISVRERKTQELLPVESLLVLDPVFLLSDEHWRGIASPRLIEEPYIFCYFLGDSTADRQNAIRFAHEKNLKAVFIPYLTNKYRKCDDFPFDILLGDVSPNDFLSLILYSEYVLTDSFHAVCFSYIFKRQFYALDRKSKANMNTRIIDILQTFGLSDRLVDSNEFGIRNWLAIDYGTQPECFRILRAESINYLGTIIKGPNNE